jgi:hypothetical protein
MDHWIWASGDRFRIETTWPSGKRIIVGDQSYADMITLGSREVVRFQGDAIGYPLFTPVASWNEVDSVRLLNQWSRSAQFDMGECGTATFVCTDSAGRNLMVPGEPSRGRVKLRYWANPYEPGPTCYEKIAVFASDSETTMKLVSAKADAPVTGRLFHLDLPTRAAIRVVALPEVVRQYPDRLR